MPCSPPAPSIVSLVFPASGLQLCERKRNRPGPINLVFTTGMVNYRDLIVDRLIHHALLKQAWPPLLWGIFILRFQLPSCMSSPPEQSTYDLLTSKSTIARLAYAKSAPFSMHARSTCMYVSTSISWNASTFAPNSFTLGSTAQLTSSAAARWTALQTISAMYIFFQVLNADMLSVSSTSAICLQYIEVPGTIHLTVRRTQNQCRTAFTKTESTDGHTFSFEKWRER